MTRRATPSPLTGVALPVGAHPQNTGGKKGRSGRKPDAFKALCRELVSAPATLEAAGAILADPQHPGWAPVFRALAAYGYGAPTQSVTVSGGVDMTVIAAATRAKLERLRVAA
jgi:hypothetical protein